MLKNKQERTDYYMNEDNWLFVQEFVEPKIRVKRLSGTDIYRIEGFLKNIGVPSHWTKLSTYLFTKNGELNSCYDLNPSAIIDYLKEL